MLTCRAHIIIHMPIPYLLFASLGGGAGHVLAVPLSKVRLARCSSHWLEAASESAERILLQGTALACGKDEGTRMILHAASSQPLCSGGFSSLQIPWSRVGDFY